MNLRSGARSQLAGLVTAVLAVAVAMFLAPLLDDLPEAVLAAMVLVAILGLLDPHDFARYARIDRAEMWVAIAVTGLCLTGGMLLGVAASCRRPHAGPGGPPGETVPGCGRWAGTEAAGGPPSHRTRVAWWRACCCCTSTDRSTRATPR